MRGMWVVLVLAGARHQVMAIDSFGNDDIHSLDDLLFVWENCIGCRRRDMLKQAVQKEFLIESDGEYPGVPIPRFCSLRGLARGVRLKGRRVAVKVRESEIQLVA